MKTKGCPLSEIRLNIHKTAALLGIDQRSLRRWVNHGLPRRSDGLFAFPATGLWWLAHQHQHDPRCQRLLEEDLLLVLRHALQVIPERANTIASVQQLLRQLSGFQLSPETVKRLSQR
ncbi:hypothetical protein [Nitrospira sp. Nam74]